MCSAMIANTTALRPGGDLFDDPVRNYIVKLETGEKLRISGTNVITEPYYLIIRKPER